MLQKRHAIGKVAAVAIGKNHLLVNHQNKWRHLLVGRALAHVNSKNEQQCKNEHENSGAAARATSTTMFFTRKERSDLTRSSPSGSKAKR